jgi:hypothetical protein
MTDTRWDTTTPAEAGFGSDLDENFEIARQAGTLPNLHGVIAARGGRIFFERYLAGPDAGRSPLGVVRFGPDRPWCEHAGAGPDRLLTSDR